MSTEREKGDREKEDREKEDRQMYLYLQAFDEDKLSASGTCEWLTPL